MSVHKNPRFASTRILIAEDSPTQRAEIMFLLEDGGFQVIESRDGREALARAREEVPDLIVSDVVMPEMTGFDLCRALRKDPVLRDVPVVLVTTLSSPTDVFLGLECGADNFITKPYDQKYLLSRIEYILANRELRKSGKLQVGIEIELGGERHFITAERQQILDLLVSTYEQAVRLNQQVQEGQQLLAQSYDTLNALYRVAEGLNACRTEGDVAKHTLEGCMSLPGVQAGWIMLRDDGEFVISETRNLSDGMVTTRSLDPQCHCQRKLMSGEFSFAQNVENCEWLATQEGEAGQIRCHATIPLIADNVPVGLLNLAGRGEGRFSDGDLKTLSTIGQQVAIALERIRLHQGLEATVEQRTAELRREIVVRREAEVAATRAETTLRDAIESIGEAFSLFDSDDRLVLYNKRAQEIDTMIAGEVRVGMAFEDIIRRGVERGIYPDAVGREDEFLRERLRIHRTADGRPLEVRRADGRWHRITETRTSDGGTVGVRADVTNMKRIQSSLATRARQQAALADLGQRALTGAALSELFEQVVTVVPKVLELPFCKVFRHAPGAKGEMILAAGYGWRDGYVGVARLAPGRGSQAGFTIATDATVIVRDWSKEMRFDKPQFLTDHGIMSGVTVPILGTGSAFGVLGVDNVEPMEFADDAVNFLQSVANVISIAVQRMHHEEGLRQADELIEAVLDSSPTAIFTLDRDGKVLTWNRAAEGISGYATEEVLGIPYPLMPKEHKDLHKKLFATVKGGGSFHAVETASRHKSGNLFPSRLSGAPLHDDNGQFRGGSFTLEDLTEKRKVEDQLRQAQKMEAIGNLTGGIAHDFNNLLAITIGNLDMLEEKLENDPAAKEMASMALTASLRGADLTRQLLAFARRQTLEPRVTDINALIQGLAKLLGRTLGENIEIKTILSDGVWPVMIDPSQLDSTLVNLSVNARDAMPDGGTLCIETRNVTFDEENARTDGALPTGDYVVIQVSDTGKGMPPDILQRIFEPFFTTKETGKGTGLGLAMVFGFVKQSEGHVTVYSEVDHGTTFRIYLPRASKAAVAAAASQATDAHYSERGGERILVVEDNPAVRKSVIGQLTGLGYRTVEVTGGNEALRMLERDHAFDLVFSDVVMGGGIGGFELCEKVKKRWPKLKVLLTSGFPETILNGTQKHVVPILSKPYRKADLAKKIREILST